MRRCERWDCEGEAVPARAWCQPCIDAHALPAMPGAVPVHRHTRSLDPRVMREVDDLWADYHRDAERRRAARR